MNIARKILFVIAGTLIAVNATHGLAAALGWYSIGVSFAIGITCGYAFGCMANDIVDED